MISELMTETIQLCRHCGKRILCNKEASSSLSANMVRPSGSSDGQKPELTGNVFTANVWLDLGQESGYEISSSSTTRISPLPLGS